MLPSQVWQLCGKNQNGPNAVVLGGTHGDELTGIELVKRVLKAVGLHGQHAGTYHNDHVFGNLFLGFGNPRAIELNSRGASAERNLNRSFSSLDIGRPPRPDDPPDVVRARELAPLFQETDYLFDIHATSSPSEPFVCFGEYASRFGPILELIPVTRVITDPYLLYTKDFGLPELGTTDYYVNAFGGSAWSERHFGKRQGLGLCYETGQETDLESVGAALYAVIRLLGFIGVIDKDLEQYLHKELELTCPKYPEQQHIFAITHCVNAQQGAFTYAEGMDRGWREVSEQCLVGEYADGTPVYTPSSGYIVFQVAPYKINISRRLFCIAQELLP